MVSWINSRADVVTYGLPGYGEVPGQLRDESKAIGPDVDEDAPELIMESSRILKPEYESIPSKL